MQDYEYGGRNPMLAPGEAILWRGKPQKKGFIATKSLTLMPIAIIWLILDSSFIFNFALGGGPGLMFMVPFFALHLMPVWIWLGSVITAGRRWKNAMYYVTNRRIIIQGGYFAVNENSLFFKDIRNAHVRIGLLDKLFGTGDIVFDNGMIYHTRNGNRRAQLPAMEDLENPYDVYNRVQRVILDIQTDMEFPNAYRPAENPGYGTDYRP